MAIAIPVFTSQLEKSREATDIANVRSAYAEVVTHYLSDGNSGFSITVDARQAQDGWQGSSGTIVYQGNGSQSASTYDAKTSGQSYAVKISVDSSGAAVPVVD